MKNKKKVNDYFVWSMLSLFVAGWINADIMYHDGVAISGLEALIGMIASAATGVFLGLRLGREGK